VSRLCAVSIDVDPLSCYYRIHGLGEAREDLRDVIMRRCVPRFAELFERRGIRATFFIVGSDIDVELDPARARAARSLLGDLLGAGHELGNHSYSHPYELARLSSAEVELEIGRADELLAEVIGRPVHGFRAPGYDISPTMIDVLMRRGYRYDSSIFPAPGYYAAKALVMGAMRLVGRRSGAVLINPRALTAPANPYRPSVKAPWRRGQAPLVELPIAVTPYGRTPAIGTSILLAPDALRAHWLQAMRGRRFFNFELHGIDLIDADEDGIPGELVSREPAARVPLVRKQRALEATLDRLALDYEFITCTDAAAWAQREVV
jgi:peptidoglycan/xylan/chitin deacetylase (PgdA/CDA1 family)